MSALRRIKKVKEGYEVTVSCTNKPMLTAFYRTYEQCEKFADDYFIDYLGVSLNSVHHPENDGVVPESLNAESLETAEIEIPMNKRLKELAEQAGLEELGDGDWCSLNHPDVRAEHLERFAELVRQDYLRELKALKPVAWMLPEYGDVLSAAETQGVAGIYNIPLYALDEVTK
jgi:hypothetical protein